MLNWEGFREEYPGQRMIQREFATALAKAYHFINHDSIEGDYLEFGVYRGWSLRESFDIARRYRLAQMRFFGFDSFQGLPEVEDKSCAYFQQGCMRGDKRHVESLFDPTDLGYKVHLIEGFFNEILTQSLLDRHSISKAAIINIDCDIYESATHVFPFITLLLQPGTVIFLDDWYCYRGLPDRGIQKAFYEWTSENPKLAFFDFLRYGVHGKVVVCRDTQ